MEIADELREMILCGASSLELKNKALEQGMISLRQGGLRQIREGHNTVEEVVLETVLQRQHSRRPPRGDKDMAVTLHQLLKTLVEQGGTDLHLTTNSPPQIRVDGK